MRATTSLLRLFTGDDPPLDPSADEARRLAEEELSRPEYHQPGSLIDQIVGWLFEKKRDFAPRQGFEGDGTIGLLIMTVLAGALLALIVMVILRLRRNPRGAKGGVFEEDELLAPAEYRSRAREALARGDWDAAYLDAFRALVSRSAERTLLDDAPALTAHEVGVQLRGYFTEHATALTGHADGFDRLRYGGGHATEPQARGALAFEDVIARTTPDLSGAAWDAEPVLAAPGSSPRAPERPLDDEAGELR